MATKKVIKNEITSIYNTAVISTREYMKKALDERLANCKTEIELKNAEITRKYTTVLGEINDSETAEIKAIKAKYDGIRKQASLDRDYAFSTVREEVEAKVKESLDEFAPYIKDLKTAGATLENITVVND